MEASDLGTTDQRDAETSDEAVNHSETPQWSPPEPWRVSAPRVARTFRRESWAGPESANSGYRPGLDGLRALAVAAVLLYHAGVRWMPGGFLGVDLFFVISGFLITSLLIKELQRAGQVDFPAFFRRRARRLLPALGIVLIVTAAGLVLFWPQELVRVRGDIVASLGYVTNWWFIIRHQSYFQATGRPSPFQHLWSLAVEEQFYLVWPLTVALVLKAGTGARRLGLLGLIAAGGAVASTFAMAMIAIAHNVPYGADASRVYYGTDTHAMGVLLGAAAAAAVARAECGQRIWRIGGLLDLAGGIGLAALCWGMVRTNEFVPWLYRGGFLLFAMLAVLPVVATSRAESRLGEVLGYEPLRWIGTRSYGLYLWHWPIFVFTRPQLDLPFSRAGDLLLRLALTGLAAEASYRLVEQPIRERGLQPWLEGIRKASSIAPTRRAATTLRVACVVIAVVAGSFLIAGRPRHATQVAARQVSAMGTIVAKTFVPAPKTTAAASPAARAGPAPPVSPAASGAPTALAAPGSITAIGDSVMLGAAADLQRALPGAVVNAVEGRQAPDAFAAIDKLLASGQLGRTVVLQTGTNGAIDPAALNALLAKLEGRRVILLNVHVPRPWQNPDNAVLSEGVRAHGKVNLIDWNAVASAHPQWLWDDGVHLRGTGAEQYTQMIVAALR